MSITTTPSLAVVGLGNMGISVLGACLSRGLSCLAIDLDEQKTAALAQGRCIVPEQDAEAIFTAACAEGRLHVSRDLTGAADARMVFIGVQTPARGADCDYTALCTVLSGLARVASPGQVLTVGSTVFPGAIEQYLQPLLASRPDLELVYQPVFLRAGFGIVDYQRPGKLILGLREPARPPEALEALLARVVDVQPRYVSYGEAEWIKMVHNAWMCVKIAFANEMGALCAEHGADGSRVLDLAFSETPHGRLLTPSHMRPGPPYSGPCLPKDAQILQGYVDASPHRSWFAQGLCGALRTSNDRHVRTLVDRWIEAGRQSGGPLGVVGVAFRPDFNEIRGSLALHFLRAAEREGLVVLGYDPMFEGIAPDAFRLAARQDRHVETLHATVSHTLADVWGRCGVVLLNRRLSAGERRIVRDSPVRPAHLIDLYDNGALDAPATETAA